MLGPNAVYYLTWLKQLVVVMIQETEGLFFNILVQDCLYNCDK